MVALKILMLIFLNHPKREIGKFMPSISHNYSTVDPCCAVIAKILQWLYGHVVFAKILEYVAIYRAIVIVPRIPIFFRPQIEVAIELLSGIKMFLISMVALKMLIPQNF